jgi:hypothetical protein
MTEAVVVARCDRHVVMSQDSLCGFVPVDLDTNDLDTNDLDTNDLDTNDLDTNDLDTNDLDTNDLDTNDLDTDDLAGEINSFQLGANATMDHAVDRIKDLAVSSSWQREGAISRSENLS